MSRKTRNKPLWDARTPAIAPEPANARETASTVSIQAAEIARLSRELAKTQRACTGIHKAFSTLRQCLGNLNTILKPGVVIKYTPEKEGQ